MRLAPWGHHRKEAEREQVRLLRELQIGTCVEPNSLSLVEFLILWLGYVVSIVRPKSLEFYTDSARKYVANERASQVFCPGHRLELT